MAEAKKFGLEADAPIVEDEAIRDAEAGRVVPAEGVREDWLAIALQMQRDARAGLAIERKHLQEILAQREGSKPPALQTSEPPTLSQSARKDGAPS